MVAGAPIVITDSLSNAECCGGLLVSVVLNVGAWAARAGERGFDVGDFVSGQVEEAVNDLGADLF